MINQYSFKFNQYNNKIEFAGSLSFPVSDSFCSVVQLPDIDLMPGQQLTFQVQAKDGPGIRISYEDHRLIDIQTEVLDDWKEFINSKFHDVVALIIALLIETADKSVLWIEPCGDELAWILGIVRNTQSYRGMLVKRKIPLLNPDYFLSGIHDRENRAEELHGSFKSWLGSDFPFCSESVESAHQLLTVKVNPGSTWFLLFPLSHFCQFKYGYFKRCQEPEWIVTNKNFVQNTLERLQMEKELNNAEMILRHSTIILNTYSHWESKVVDTAQTGLDLMMEILVCFKDVCFQVFEPIFLRWYINPTYNDVFNELINPDTWYFFADFHVNDGSWQIGDGKKHSWMSQRISDSNNEKKFIHLNDGLDLSHKRLMRVFHCESVFEAGTYYTNGSEPADAHSIARRLLDYGAKRVEGGMTTESFFDYLCSLFDLLCKDQGLGPVLQAKCLESGSKYHDLIRRVNQFLVSCGWDKI